MNKSAQLFEKGQSIWYDNIDRTLLENGYLKDMVERKEIYGVTSNPSIFEKAISTSSNYDDSLQAMAWAGLSKEQIYLRLVIEDIQAAADLLKPTYQSTNLKDGYVSLEVSPLLANDTEGTIQDAKTLWNLVNRKNLMIKIPATFEGLPAITELIAAGINVNVTLIFSVERYKLVMEAFLKGLEKRLKDGLPLKNVASVASFFISRIDTVADKLLADLSSQEPDKSDRLDALMGRTAINNASLAYSAFKQVFSSERFNKLALQGAQVQRPLWASTGTKNPNYSDLLYVDTLIVKNTVNTVPPATLKALLDHCNLESELNQNFGEIKSEMDWLKAVGLDLDKITEDLEVDGIQKFVDAYEKLIGTIEAKRKVFLDQVGSMTSHVQNALQCAGEQVIVSRMYEHDPSLWTDNSDDFEEIRNRLGWLGLPSRQLQMVDDLNYYREQKIEQGFTHVFVLGMGGSSLAPEVLSEAIGPMVEPGRGLNLQIIDTTNPEEILARTQGIDLKKSLFIVASKSGTTSETMAAYQYFWQKIFDLGMEKPGDQFIAITDPGTSLERLAKMQKFDHVFFAPKDVGGRYSVFTPFGLVPAALIGVDILKLLSNAIRAERIGERDIPYAANANLLLGLLIGCAAKNGREKLTFITESYSSHLVPWLEQLIAESSGKEGRGILPIEGEPSLDPESYNNDRLFVYLRVDDSESDRVQKVMEQGHPVIELSLKDPYDLGFEFYRWEYATAIACAVLRVNAFNQPNVQESKLIAKAKIEEYQQKGKLVEEKPIWENQQATIFGMPVDGLTRATYLGEAMQCFYHAMDPTGYVAINAYLPRINFYNSQLVDLRGRISKNLKKATTIGYGPRFQHSTGQLHKGGFPGGLFILITYDAEQDLEIPGENMSFATLQKAQAMGDLEALLRKDRLAIRVHLKKGRISDLFKES